MRTHVPAILISSMFVMVALLLPLPGTTVVGQIGDWIIDGPGEVIEGEQRTLTHSIIVNSGGGLTISNSTITFDLSKDASKGLILKGGGTMTITNSTITAKNRAFAPVFESSGTLTIADSRLSNLWGSWDIGGGVQVRGGKATITGSSFKDSKRDGVTFTDGVGSVVKSTFTGNIVGLRCKGAEGILIDGNEFRSNTQQAIMVLDSSAIIRNNIIDTNQLGIALSGSDVNIQDNTIRESSVAIDVSEGSTATIERNLLSENQAVGIRVTNSTADIEGNDITSNGDGIRTFGGEVVVRSNTIIGNDLGVDAREGTSGTVQGNEIGGNTQYGIRMLGAQLTVVSDNNYSPPNGKGHWVSVWMFQVKVLKHGDPVDDADVEIKDATGKVVFTGGTNSSGLTATAELVEMFEDNSGALQELTPHKVLVEHKGNTGRRKVTIDENQTYEVELEDVGGQDTSLFQLMLVSGIILIIIALIMGARIWLGSKDEGPERKSKASDRKRRSGRRALTSTAASRRMRVRRAGRKRRGGKRSRAGRKGKKK